MLILEVSLKDISSYIDFLITKNGLYVTLHGAFVCVPELVKYNCHFNPYCCFVKTATSNWETCIKNQEKVLKKCEAGEFFGTCHAGVGEFVYPISTDGKVLGFISVSGYRNGDTSKQKSLHFARKNGVSRETADNMRSRYLNGVIPSKTSLDAVIHPLLFMLVSYLKKGERFSANAELDLYTKLFNYITAYHNTRITMKELSGKFNCSVSSLSHLFKKRSGMSISEYIEKLRLDEAKWLLSQSRYTVTEVSDCLGFCNSGYFSSVFKRKFGISPKDYRKSS